MIRDLFPSDWLRADALDFGAGFGHVREVEAESGGSVAVDSQSLLFHGQYARDGADLIVTDFGERLVVHGYFAVADRPKLVAPNGASLADAVIDALVGGVDLHAQADGVPALPPIGRVQTVGGTATVLRNGAPVALNVGDLVYKGDVVQTGAGSNLTIALVDGSLFSLAASARMVLNEMVFQEGGGGSALITLIEGTITFVAGKVAKTGDMKVTTPVATMGIRGTAVHVQIEADDGTSRFSVMTEPDGHTGRFDVYDRTDGRLLFTVSDPGLVYTVRPNGQFEVRFETSAKSAVEIAAEAVIVQNLFKALSDVPKLPVPLGPGGSGGSGTQPGLILPDGGRPGEGPGTPAPGQTPGTEPSSPGETPPRGGGIDGEGPGGEGPIRDGRPPILAGGGSTFTLASHSVDAVQGSSLIVASASLGVLAATVGVQIVTAHAFEGAAVAALEGRYVLTGRYGTLLLNADGTFLYVADRATALGAGQSAADVFVYEARNASGSVAAAELTVAVTGLNDAPVVGAPPDLGSGRGARIIKAADLVAGASDPDGDALALADLHVASGGGRLEDLGGGQYRYVPASAEGGAVVLAYAVTDGHGGSTAQTAGLFAEALRSDEVLVGDFSASATGAYGSPSGRVTVAVGSETGFRMPDSLEGSYGTFAFDPATGSWHYDLAVEFERFVALPEGRTATEHLTVTSADGSATRDIVVTVVGRNDAPVAGDDRATAGRDGSATIGVLANDRDPDGDAIRVASAGGAAHGTVTINADGTLTYRAAEGFVGTDNFTYILADVHGAEACGAVMVEVPPLAPPPENPDVFLRNAYLELGVSRSGSLGTTGGAPEGFHPVDRDGRISFVFDGDGFGRGAVSSGDFTLPGVSEDAIVVGYDGRVLANSERTGERGMALVTTDTSFAGHQRATTEGVTEGGLHVSQTIDLATDATYFVTTVTLRNDGSAALSDVRFMRTIDPDPDLDRYRTYDTINDVLANPSDGSNLALVQARGPESGIAVNLLAYGDEVRASSGTFPVRAIYGAATYDRPSDPDGSRADVGISLNLKFGDLAPGESVTRSFYTAFDTAGAGTAGHDILAGTPGADRISGLAGDDMLFAIGRGDTLTGGAGADTFAFVGRSFGQATVTDFTPGQDELLFDRVAFASAQAARDAAVQVGADVEIRLDAADVVILKHLLLADLHAEDIRVIGPLPYV